MRRVIVETPYAGTTWWLAPLQRWINRRFARACLRDCWLRGEAPFASHLIYTQRGVLCDEKADERTRGIIAGLAWGELARATVVYLDRGISAGMRHGIRNAELDGRPIEYRWLQRRPADAEFFRAYDGHLPDGGEL